MADTAEAIDGRFAVPAIREKRVAARIPLSMILRLIMRRQTKPKKSRAARINRRSRVSAFCMVVINVLEALRRREKEVYCSEVRVSVCEDRSVHNADLVS